MIKINIRKKLISDENPLIIDINTDIEKQSFVGLFGKSGAGKTSILKILIGVMNPDEGEILIDNKVIFSSAKKINIPTQKRGIGMVFQDYALFPHLNVYKNIGFGLKNKKNKNAVNEIIELMELKNIYHLYPHQLSGGQKQRVALARAIICNDNKILLLDEPLSALDNETREKLQNEIINWHKYFNLTTILVSHNINEMYKLSNRILKIQNGKIQRDFKIDNALKNISLNAKIIDIEEENNMQIIKFEVKNREFKIQNSGKEKFSIGENIIIEMETLKIKHAL